MPGSCSCAHPAKVVAKILEISCKKINCIQINLMYIQIVKYLISLLFDPLYGIEIER